MRTARSMGWEDKDNGELLKAAAAGFDVLLTLDRGIPFQQHASSLPIAIIVMLAFNNRPETIAPFAPAVLKLLGERLERRVYIVDTRA
ncbi:MAG: hypothetical protein JSR77_01965 [Planctomycetes bacterium]|nr:hypothetical protein [Planctomycetota bacterium]